MLGGAPISQAFPSASMQHSKHHRRPLDDDDSDSIIDTMNASESLAIPEPRRKETKEMRETRERMKNKSKKKSRQNMRAAPMQPIDPDVYLPDRGGAPLGPGRGSKREKKRDLFIPADGGSMGFASSELSAFSSPFGEEEADIDFYSDDDHDHDHEHEHKAAATVAATDVDTDVDDVDDHKQQHKQHNLSIAHADSSSSSSVSIDLGIYIISGLFLILLMEQFIQLGMRMRS